MAWPYMLKNAEKLLNTAENLTTLTINSLLEYHHINKYFENDLSLSHWTVEQKDRYLEIVQSALNEIRIRFLALKDADLINEISKLEFDNRESFWELFQYFKLYKKADRSPSQKFYHCTRNILGMF